MHNTEINGGKLQDFLEAKILDNLNIMPSYMIRNLERQRRIQLDHGQMRSIEFF